MVNIYLMKEVLILATPFIVNDDLTHFYLFGNLSFFHFINLAIYSALITVGTV